MPVKQNNFKKRRFPLFSGSLVSRLSRAARDEMYSDAALEALSRLRQRYSQEELGSMLTTSAPVVRSWEKRRRRPSGAVRAAILILEKAEAEKHWLDDYLTRFGSSTREVKTAVIRYWEAWVEQLKKIEASFNTNRRDQVTISAEVADRWARTCREFVRLNPLVDVPHDAKDANGRVEADGSLTIFAPLPDGSELSMRVEPDEWQWSNRNKVENSAIEGAGPSG